LSRVYDFLEPVPVFNDSSHGPFYEVGVAKIKPPKKKKKIKVKV